MMPEKLQLPRKNELSCLSIFIIFKSYIYHIVTKYFILIMRIFLKI